MNSNNKTLPLILGIVVVFIIGLLFLMLFNFFMSAKKGSVRINNVTISVEVANSPQLREKGLSGRKSLAENKGMLFVFDTPDYHRFWMKDMKFPLDIIFLNDTKVVTLYENVPSPVSQEENANPPIYTSTAPANRVLELPAGSANKLGLKQGDDVAITL